MGAVDVARRSFWLHEALGHEQGWERAVHPLESDLSCDIAIVGGGFTGLWTALELKRRDPSRDVVVLEASLCGSGASGTNAGYLMNLWPKYNSLVAAGGPTDALAVARHSSEAVSEIISFIEEHQLDVGLRAHGWLSASTNASQDGAWGSLLEQLQTVPGSPLRALGADEASRLAGTEVRGGVLDPTCAVLQPASLVRALRRIALTCGVRIFENTPMAQLTTDGALSVRTPRGAVKAQSVVLAINAWAMRFRQVRRHMVVTASDNIVTQPMEWPDGPFGSGVGVSDQGRLLNYWRTTADGRLLFGKGGLAVGWGSRGADTLFSDVINEQLVAARAGRILPRLSYRTEFRWRAPVEYSTTSLPFFTAWEGHPRVFIGTGYSGDGVGPSKLGGKILASLAMGVDDEWSTSPLTRTPTETLPPDPIRYVGGQVVGRALIRQDSDQAGGRSTGPLTRAVTRLDPTAWIE